MRIKGEDELKYIQEEQYTPREVTLPQSDPITVVGEFKARRPADSLARAINTVVHGAK